MEKITNIDEEEKFDQIDCLKYFNEIKKISNDMISEIDYSTKIKNELREDAYIILEAIVNACELQNLKILNGLIVGFDFVATSIKPIKFLYKEMKNVLVEFYEELQN